MTIDVRASSTGVNDYATNDYQTFFEGIEQVYGHEHAFQVVAAAIEDYDEEYGAD